MKYASHTVPVASMMAVDIICVCVRACVRACVHPSERLCVREFHYYYYYIHTDVFISVVSAEKRLTFLIKQLLIEERKGVEFCWSSGSFSGHARTI